MNYPRKVVSPSRYVQWLSVLSYGKHYPVSTFFGGEKEKYIWIYPLKPGHLEAEQNFKYKRLLQIKTNQLFAQYV